MIRPPSLFPTAHGDNDGSVPLDQDGGIHDPVLFCPDQLLAVQDQDHFGERSTVSRIILSYLDDRAKIQSNRAFNKDRKNLLAMWNWRQEIPELQSNPVMKIKKRPHDRSPQYVPPTEGILRILAVASRVETVLLDCYL